MCTIALRAELLTHSIQISLHISAGSSDEWHPCSESGFCCLGHFIGEPALDPDLLVPAEEESLVVTDPDCEYSDYMPEAFRGPKGKRTSRRPRQFTYVSRECRQACWRGGFIIE